MANFIKTEDLQRQQLLLFHDPKIEKLISPEKSIHVGRSGELLTRSDTFLSSVSTSANAALSPLSEPSCTIPSMPVHLNCGCGAAGRLGVGTAGRVGLNFVVIGSRIKDSAAEMGPFLSNSNSKIRQCSCACMT